MIQYDRQQHNRAFINIMYLVAITYNLYKYVISILLNCLLCHLNFDIHVRYIYNILIVIVVPKESNNYRTIHYVYFRI